VIPVLLVAVELDAHELGLALEEVEHCD